MSGYLINDEIKFALDIDRAADLARRAEKREARKVRKAELKARRGAARTVTTRASGAEGGGDDSSV